MSKFIVEYSLAYEHVCRIGIEAETQQVAEDYAWGLFDDGTFWDNTPQAPLLYDDYEEQNDNVLSFTATQCDDWSPDASVETLLRHNASRLLLDVVELVAAGNTDLDRLTTLANEALYVARYGRPMPKAVA